MRTKKIIAISFSLLVLFISCKKEKNIYGTEQKIAMHKLNGDTAVLIGTWNWIYSDHQYNGCDPPASYEVVTPSTEGFDFSIKFIQEGLVYFYKNDSLVAEHRLFFRDFSYDSPACVTADGSKYYIYLDGLEDKTMSGCIDYDTLMRTGFSGFLLREAEGCGYYNNFFTKE